MCVCRASAYANGECPVQAQTTDVVTFPYGHTCFYEQDAQPYDVLEAVNVAPGKYCWTIKVKNTVPPCRICTPACCQMDLQKFELNVGEWLCWVEIVTVISRARGPPQLCAVRCPVLPVGGG